MRRVSSIAIIRRALPGFARCERPSIASLRISGDQPGRFAVGPEEKRGLAGRSGGRSSVVILATLSDRRPSLGRGVPLSGLAKPAADVKPQRRESAAGPGRLIARLIGPHRVAEAGGGTEGQEIRRRPLKRPADWEGIR